MTDETSAGSELDRQIQAYLADVERSLLETSLHEAQLQEALENRTTIGQAVGLLMAHSSLTSDEAFQKLVRISQTSNIKLRDIARRYVEAWENTVMRPQQ